MKKLIVLCAIALTTLLLLTPVIGCQHQPQPAATPSMTIMVESNSVEAGSYFVVSASNLKPKEWVFVDFEYRAGNRREALTAYDEADEQGSIQLTIEVPEDVVSGDYEVKISTGATKHIKDRHLIATLPIHVEAMEE